MPFGKGIKESLNYTLAIGKELGFSVYNYDNYAGVIEAGEGDDYSGILCHLKSFGIKCSDNISGDLTVNPGALEISADKLVFGFDIRFPVTADKNIIVEQLKKVIERYDLEYRELQYKAPLYIPKESILIKKLQRAYSAVTGEDPKLVAIGGGTYSRYLDNTVAFGPVFPDEEELAHEPNEFIDIDRLILMTHIYARAIYELVN